MDEQQARIPHRGISGPFIVNGHVTNAVQCCDITYDITASFNDVTLANKMMSFRHATSGAHLPKIAQNGRKDMSKVATVHLECWVFHAMPHPPPCIWAHPDDRSLQPLYLSTITTTISFITKTKIESNVYTPVLSTSR